MSVRARSLPRAAAFAFVASVLASNPAHGAGGGTVTKPARPAGRPDSPVTYVTGIPGNVVKTFTDVNGGQVQPGDVLQVDIVVFNAAVGNASVGTVVDDVIPSGTTYVPNSLVIVAGANAGSKTDATGDDQADLLSGPSAVRFRIGSTANATQGGRINPGGGARLRFSIQVSPSALNGQVISNQAFVSYRDAGTDEASIDPSGPVQGNPGPTIVTVEAPDLSIAKSHSGSFTVGINGQWTLVVTNSGAATTTGTITVTDTLPIGLNYVSVNAPGWTCTAALRIGTCTHPGPLAPSASLPAIVATVSVGAAAVPMVTNRGWVATSGDNNPANDVSADPTVVNPTASPDATILKSHTGSFTVGTTNTYTLTVSNVGSAATTGTITITDVLPAGLTFAGGVGGGWSCSAAGQTVTCTNPGPLAPSSALPSVSLTVAVGAAAVPSVTNTATVATPGDNNAANDASSDPTTVNPAPPPDLSLAKSHTGSFVVGSTGSYQLTVTNVGTGPTTAAITVTDVLPNGLSFVSGTGTGWSCGATGQTVTCANSSPLAAGSALPSLTLAVAVGAAALPSVTNVASVATAGDANGSNDSATDPTTVDPAPAPDLAIGKTHTGSFTVGVPGVYTLTVSNVGTAPTSGMVTVADVLPNGLGFVSGTGTNWSCAAVAQVVTCSTPGPLAPSASLPPITLGVSVGALAVPSVTNTATVSTAGDGNAANDAASDVTAVGASGIDLAIGKTAAPGTFVVGASASYTLTVSNVGSSATTGPLVVTDTIPAGVVFASVSAPTFTCALSGVVLSCTRPSTLAPSSSASLTISVNVASGAGSSVTNRAHVSTAADANPSNDVAQVVTPVAAPPDLALTKSAAGAFAVGQPAAFLIAVQNVGGSPTTGVITVTDTMPNGISFTGATGPGWTCTSAPPVVSCSTATSLAAGATSTLTLFVAVGSAAVPAITNTAHVATPGDGVAGNNAGAATVAIGAAGASDLAVQKVAVGSFTIGVPATYQITVSNVGAAPTSGSTTVTDVLPGSLTYVSASGSGWSCSAVGQTVSCTYGAPIAPTQAVAVTLVVRPTASAQPAVTNTASVAGSGDANPTNDTSTATTPVTGAIDLALDKRLSGAFAKGAPATYALTISNVGQLPASGAIVVLDTLPNGLAFVGGSGSGFACAAMGQVVTCTRATTQLNPAESATITMTVSVRPTAPDTIANSACVRTAGDQNTANDCGRSVNYATSTPDLAVTKTHVEAPRIGQLLTFRLRVRNMGSAPTSAPVILDDGLPSGLVYVSASGAGWSCVAPGGNVTCTRTTALAAADSSDVLVVTQVTPLAVPAVTNCARVHGVNETNAANNQSCDVVAVAGDYRLEIDKKALRTDVEIGDQVEYAIGVRNSGGNAILDAVVHDRIPAGFEFVSGSVRLEGRRLNDPSGAPGPQLEFPIGAVPLGGRVQLLYRLRVGVGARPGTSVNSAFVRSVLSGTQSATVTAAVSIRPGLFGERGAIVGKVLRRCAPDGQRANPCEDAGIPGVRLLLEDGTSAITDEEGKYSFLNIAPRLHVVRIDRTTLPDSAVLVPSGARNAGDGYSRFVDLKLGELHRADFIEASGRAAVAAAVTERRRIGEVTRAGGRGVDVQQSAEVARTGVRGAAFRGPGRRGGYRPLFDVARLNDLTSQLPATPLRALAAQRAAVSGATRAIEIIVGASGVPADGRSRLGVIVRVPDNTAPPLRITLEASLGRWDATDADPVQEGVQVTLAGNEGQFELVAPYMSGVGEVRATSAAATGTAVIDFVPAPRPLFASGVLNARLDLLSVLRGGSSAQEDGGFEDVLRDASFERDSGKVHGGVRGAVLVQGRVLGDQLLTLAYDSERDTRRTFFRDIQPDEGFALAGDASLRDFGAQSTRRFFAQLDRGASFTRFGDFETNRADDRRQLSAYDRTLNGAVEHVEGERGALTVFASRDRSRQVVDELPARGISGPYPLTRDGLANSERVEIVTRDRNQPSLILSRVPLTRFADYTIEPLTGRLVLRQPLNPVDANLNPVSIRITYEAESAADGALWTYGGDAVLRLASALEAGASYVVTDTGSSHTNILGLHGTARLGAGTYVVGEWARTDDGAGRVGGAQRFDLRHTSGRLDARVFGATSDADFANRSSTFASSRTELGARWSAVLNDRTRLLGEALRTEDNATNGRRDGALVGVERRLSRRLRAELGYRYAKEDGPAPANAFTFGAVPNNTSAIRARLSADVPERRSSFFAEYEQDIRERDQRRAAVGGEYVVFDRTRLYARHEWISSFGGAYALNRLQDQQLTSIGVDADYLRNTQLFSEYRARDAFNGRDAEASIGVRNAWSIAKGVSLNTSFSRVSPLAGDGLTPVSGQLATATSVAGGLAITRSPLWKATGRLEYRTAETGDNVFGSVGLARKLNEDWTLLGRSLWDVAESGLNQARSRTQLGVAWRETRRNRWNALARYENRYEHVSGVDESPGALFREPWREMAHIVATMLNFQPSAPVTLSGRYAAKVATVAHSERTDRSTAQLLMGRGLFDVRSRADVGVIGSLLFSDGLSTRRYGLGGEVGLTLLTNLRVAAGYNVFGFTDRALDAFGTTRKGPYVELGFKFDESLFGQRQPDAACGAVCRSDERRN